MKRNRNKAIYLVIFIVAICAIFSGYRYNKIRSYDKLVSSGKTYMDKGKYDKALECFNSSLDYKKNEKVDKYIKTSKQLKNEKDLYDEGITLVKNKKYYKALKNFNKITQKDEKLYYNANKEIRNCNKEIITQSKEYFKKGEYNKAKNNLNKVLEFDPDNKDAIDIKNSIDEKINSNNNFNNNQYNHKKENSDGNNKDIDTAKKVNSSIMITRETAEKLVDSIKEKNVKLQYLGIEKVPYPNIRESYKAFPKELIDERVYTFEGLMGSSGEEYAIGRYYIDFSGHIYKDTYPSDGKCVRIK
ncbi:hypothetical protein [Clostridium oceanicum]|uniref:Tetratricopeptide repeat protein n=1 Tax=Clostridium oceanicum TaxID=1543 RepID=A0ABP3UPG1_9CLOT